jgi:hypothetical protein
MRFRQWFLINGKYASLDGVLSDESIPMAKFDIIAEMKAAIIAEGIKEGGIPCDPPPEGNEILH